MENNHVLVRPKRNNYQKNESQVCKCQNEKLKVIQSFNRKCFYLVTVGRLSLIKGDILFNFKTTNEL